MWQIETTERFNRSYRKLSSQIRARVGDAVASLARSENPAGMGIKKRGAYRGYLAYEIGRSHRLIYRVIDRERIILLVVVVGDHKSVYGRD